MDRGTDSYRRFLDGDETGLFEIITEYRDGLMLYLNGFTGNIHSAEELAEDTFVKLGIKRPKDHGKASFKTWLYTIGRNLAIDYLRKKPRDSGLIAAEIPDDYDLEREAIEDERKRLLHKTLGKLNENYRDVLYLSYFEGFKNAQIAVIMKKNTRQIENLLYQAKLALKKELDKEGFIYEEL